MEPVERDAGSGGLPESICATHNSCAETVVEHPVPLWGPKDTEQGSITQISGAALLTWSYLLHPIATDSHAFSNQTNVFDCSLTFTELVDVICLLTRKLRDRQRPNGSTTDVPCYYSTTKGGRLEVATEFTTKRHANSDRGGCAVMCLMGSSAASVHHLSLQIADLGAGCHGHERK